MDVVVVFFLKNNNQNLRIDLRMREKPTHKYKHTNMIDQHFGNYKTRLHLIIENQTQKH